MAGVCSRCLILAALGVSFRPGGGPLAAQAISDSILTKEAFLTIQWRLAGMVFAVHQAGGFPIVFRRDGSLITRNLGGAVRWELNGRKLTLHGESRPFYHFEWNAEREIFWDCQGTSTRPAMVIYPAHPRGLTSLYPPCDGTALDNPGLECRLEVSPAESRAGGTVEFRYVITGPAGERVSTRYLGLDEETFGHSLRITSESGSAYRFLRTLGFSYRGHPDVDTGRVVPQTFRFRFPDPNRNDFSRLVTLASWWSAGGIFDSASAAAYHSAYEAGMRSFPAGEYQVHARLSPFVFSTRSRSPDPNFFPDVSRFAPLECSPARFKVLP